FGWPLDWLREWGQRLSGEALLAAGTRPRWQWIVLAALVGMVAINLVRLLVAVASAAALRRSARRIIDEPGVREMVERIAARAGCRQSIELVESARITSPATCGWRQPAILLPVDWRNWSPEELWAALAHEVAHVQRADYAQRVLALAGVAVHFYHPLVRLAARRLAVDQETAADRLARELLDELRDAGAYARGLARLALRFHESLSERRGWSSVSIMPRSSDFLARRLEMLRTNDKTSRRATRVVGWLGCGAVVLTAMTTTFLRSRAVAEEKPPADAARPVAETARVDAGKDRVDELKPAAAKDSKLFQRTPIDPAVVRGGKKGAFIIRVSEILSLPAVAPFTGWMSTAMCQALGMPEGAFDVRDVDWIGGALQEKVKMSEKKNQSQFSFEVGGAVIRMRRAADWQAFVLKNIPGTELKQYEGHDYVQFPVYEQLGPAHPCLRVVNDTTILTFLSTGNDQDDTSKLPSGMFDDAPQGYGWEDTWRAVDGGLITAVGDNREVGWQDVPEDKRDVSPDVWPMVDRTSYFGLGLDWNAASDYAGVQLRSTCADVASAEQVHQATEAFLDASRKENAEDEEMSDIAREWFAKLISSATTTINLADDAAPFVLTRMETPFNAATLFALYASPGPDKKSEKKGEAELGEAEDKGPPTED
ncbi:MAG TPA: M56 family metallopeptidase, partial [Pirellulales bacterium]|nr:M56 family metallopeptidase [Pirellulales bacterium]